MISNELPIHELYTKLLGYTVLECGPLTTDHTCLPTVLQFINSIANWYSA